jgi:hypothetical protein
LPSYSKICTRWSQETIKKLEQKWILPELNRYLYLLSNL